MQLCQRGNQWRSSTVKRGGTNKGSALSGDRGSFPVNTDASMPLGLISMSIVSIQYCCFFHRAIKAGDLT